MRRLAAVVLVLLVFTASSVAKDEPLVIEIANTGAHATALRVIEHELAALSGDFAVRGPDGKDLPAVYDAKGKKLRFLASVPAGGGKFTLHRGTKSTAKLPAWKKAKIDKSQLKLDEKKTIDWVSGGLDNGLLYCGVMAEKTVQGRVEIRTLKGDYAIRLSPLGASAGCVETAQDGAKVNEDYAKGVQKSPEIFSITPCIATAIKVDESDPLRRVIRVTCHAHARRNDGRMLDLFENLGYDITLTWNSPVVVITATRKLKTAYYNHNGVNLNEIYVDALPVGYAADGGEIKDTKPTGAVLNLNFERTMWLRDKTGSTVICQPDYKRLGIYKPCVVLASDRIMTILSQSWHEGWKAIEIKAGDYVDTMTLACNVGGDKTLADWTAELLPE
ncbi:MAG: hypothetical protein HS108_08305 [Planctomycetes bacterium]|nr:hypothetical protein [Planctomycetota bacterium]MCL4731566.1 hypothetical protein [Planctomycetota bacterium]